jgi:predicted nucleotide-binding protein (sugar kinase/HSP70/actin superfamily)
MKTYKIEIKSDEVIDENEAKECIIQTLKDELDYKQRNKLQLIAREIVSELVENIATKEFKKELREVVKNTINTHERNELTFREGYRDLLVELAREQKPLLEKKIKASLESESYQEIYSALGNVMANKFIDFVRKEN